MEGLIMMIIIAIISSVLGKGKKKDEPTKQMPPFSNQEVPRQSKPVEQPKQQRPKVKTLEDFANEVFGQLNEKSEPKKQPVYEVKEELVKPIVQEVVKKERSFTRPELGATRPIIQQAKKQPFNVVPKTQQQLMQAIITSEILASPKAKQRK